MSNGKNACYAPVFGPNNIWACLVLTIIYVLVIVVLTVLLIIAALGGPEAVRKISCLIKQYVYMIQHCTKGNSNPSIVI